MDVGESVEHAAVREALEETSLTVSLTVLLGVYSDPSRDPRGHTVSVVFIAQARGEPKAQSDAARVTVVDPDRPPSPLAFDHARILSDYVVYRREEKKPNPG